MCRQKLSADTLNNIAGSCNSTDAFAYHVEDTKCTEFSNPHVDVAPAANHASSNEAVSTPSDGGVSLTFSIKDSVCKGTGDEKKMKVTFLCDAKEPEMKFFD